MGKMYVFDILGEHIEYTSTNLSVGVQSQVPPTGGAHNERKSFEELEDYRHVNELCTQWTCITWAPSSTQVQLAPTMEPEVIFSFSKHKDLNKQQWYLQGTTQTTIVWQKNKS